MKYFCPTVIQLFAKLYRTTLCALLLNMNLGSESIMENIEVKDNKVVETLTKELESLSAEGLHEFFKLFYKMSRNAFFFKNVHLFDERFRRKNNTVTN